MIGKIKQDSNIRTIDGWREKINADNYVELTKTFSFPSVSNFTTLAGGFGAYRITNINIPTNLKDGYSVSVVDAKVSSSLTWYCGCSKTVDPHDGSSCVTVYIASVATGAQPLTATVKIEGYLK